MERPHSRYTRVKTWAALHSQHINAGYALVPYSATNNSIAVIRYKSPEETYESQRTLLQHADECEVFYGLQQAPDKVPDFLKRARHAVILAKSSDYHHYHLDDHPEFRLVICGLHDSYLQLPVWELRTNHRYDARTTAVAIGSPEFERLRGTQFGHNILLGALVKGDHAALAYLETLKPRTRRRIRAEKERIQQERYRGRPLAFLTEAKRREIGAKIREGLQRYHARRRQQIS